MEVEQTIPIYYHDNGTVPVTDAHGSYGYADSNGNGAGSWRNLPNTLVSTDGTNLDLYTISYPNYPDGNQVDLAYRDASGGTQHILLTYAGQNVSHASIDDPYTTMGYADLPLEVMPQDFNGNINLLRSVQLPSGRTYQFSYDPTYADLVSMVSPTGVTTQWTYASQNQNEIGRIATSRSVTDPTPGGGQSPVTQTWTYTYDLDEAGLEERVVWDPLQQKTTLLFQADGEEGRRRTYGADGTLLQELNDSAPFLTPTFPADPNCPLSPPCVMLNDFVGVKTVMWPQTGQAQTTTYKFDGIFLANRTGENNRYIKLHQPTETKVYNYAIGSTTPTLLKTETTQYLHIPSAGIYDRPTQHTITGGGNTFTEAWEYDNYVPGMTQTSGVPGHDYTNYSSTNTTRGNVTKHKVWDSTAQTWRSTTYAYDDLGNVLSATDPKGYTTTFSYNDLSDGYCTPPSNSHAHVTLTTDPLGRRTETTYNYCTGLRTKVRDENQIVTNGPGEQFAYDGSLSLILHTLPDGGQQSWDYHSYSMPLRTTVTTLATPDPSIVTETIRDGLGRVVQSILSPGASTASYTDTTYDALGRVATVSNPYHSVSDSTYGLTSYAYDALNRKLRECHPDNGGGATCTAGANYLHWVYTGNQTDFFDERQIVHRTFTDGLGHLISVIEPDSSSGALSMETDYQYDGLGNLLRVDQWGGAPSSPNERIRLFSYDSLSHLITSNNPESGSICYGQLLNGNCVGGYDANGNLVVRTDANGTVMHYHYDALNRMDHKWSSDGTVDAQYFFDVPDVNGVANTCENGIGRLCSAVQFGSGVAFDYDAMGRVKHTKRATEADGSVWHTGMQATYDYAGNPLTYTYPSGLSVTNEYDSAGHLNKVYNTSTPTTPYFSNAVYDPAGHLAYADYANGAFHEESNFNSKLQPCRMEVLSGAVAGSGTAYIDKQLYYGQTPETNCGTASANTGNIWSIIDGVTPSHSLGFTYDALDRLSSANRSDGQLSETYHIDGFGNMLLQDNLHTMPNYSIDPNTNRLLLNNTDYTYDAAGMLRSTGAYGHTFDYDADGNLQVLDAGKRSDGDDGDWLGSQYGYYATGERSYKTFSVDCYKDYVTLGSQVFEENNLCGPTVSYIYAGGKKVARIEGSTLKYTVNDYLGTASAEFSATGTLLWKGEFAPFGRELTPINSSTTNFKFTGKERDTESGLDYFGARYYGSSMGRFMSPDPLLNSGRPDNPQTWNRYAYALNNPLTITDPTGLYNLVNNCAADNKQCNNDFTKYAANLKNALAALNNALDTNKNLSLTQVARISSALATLGTENDGNNVNVSFGKNDDGAAATTTPFDKGGGVIGLNIQFDPTKTSLGGSQSGWAIDAAHEGTHGSDIKNPMFNDSATTLSPFQLEYRGYQTSAWTASALGVPSVTYSGNMIWNKSWGAVDDKVLTRFLTNMKDSRGNQNHPDTDPQHHNPWPN